MRDVAFLHEVFFAFDGEQSALLKGSVGAVFGKIIVFADLGPDKSALDIRMDLPRRLRGFGPLGNEPSAGFFLTGGDLQI